jgi:hypothetical protein
MNRLCKSATLAGALALGAWLGIALWDTTNRNDSRYLTFLEASSRFGGESFADRECEVLPGCKDYFLKHCGQYHVEEDCEGQYDDWANRRSACTKQNLTWNCTQSDTEVICWEAVICRFSADPWGCFEGEAWGPPNYGPDTCVSSAPPP